MIFCIQGTAENLYFLDRALFITYFILNQPLCSILVNNLCCVESLAVLVPARDEEADTEVEVDVECQDDDDGDS